MIEPIWNFLSLIGIALIELIGISITAHMNNKTKKQKEIVEETHNEIQKMRKESKADDERINRKIDNMQQQFNGKMDENTMSMDKAWLIDFMSRVRNGEKMNMEQVRIAAERKERYNNLGGDSYVDDMWDSCKENKLF